MKILKKPLGAKIAGVGLALALMIAPALGAGLWGNLPQAGGSQYPTTQPLTGNETIPADTNLGSGLNPASEVISTSQLAGYAGGQLGTWRNRLIGGDFATNLWQRGTTSASITTSLLYGPDRWWGLSGTNTAFTIIKETGATDITTGLGATARVQRTASQTGVVSTCLGQVLTSGNSYGLQNRKVELSFYGKAGANFSAANSLVTVTIATGTGTDDTAANFSTGSWTGYAAATATPVTLSTSFDRYSVTATIPSSATQVGVKLCYTPVGTAGANDWFEVGNVQLAVNAAAVAKTSSATTGSQMLAFEHRDSAVEANLQYRYYYQITESSTSAIVEGTCVSSTTSISNCFVKFPTAMRVVPTMSYATGFLSSAQAASTSGFACTSLTNSATVTGFGPSTSGVLINCASSAAGPAAGTSGFLWDAGTGSPTGAIKASAEL